MKANVIEGCISCGLCASVCPEVFRMNDENVSEVYHQPTPEQEEHLPAAPVSAQRADVFS